MNRRTSIRKRCLDCSAGSYAEVDNCEHPGCSLYSFRSGYGNQDAKARDRAIKTYCRWCASSLGEVLHCPVKICPLYPFRKFKMDHPTRIPVICNERPYTRQFPTSDQEGIPMETPDYD